MDSNTFSTSVSNPPSLSTPISSSSLPSSPNSSSKDPQQLLLLSVYQQGYSQAVKDGQHPAAIHPQQLPIQPSQQQPSILRTFIDGSLTAVFLGLPAYLIYRTWRAGRSVSGKGGRSASIMSQLAEQMNPVSKRDFKVDVSNTTFADVIGIDEAKDEVMEFVSFLRNPKAFTELGARLPRGALLTGKPGTGKTLLAKAIAGEAGVNFYSSAGSDFIEIFGGSGPKRVRELFADAKKNAPAVIFIDELDAVGAKRGDRGGGGGLGGEENRTTNALLAEMDGMGTAEGVLVFAATNHPEALDDALVRPGRFDRKINIPVPDLKARKALFDYYLNKIVTAANFHEKAAEIAEAAAKEKEKEDREKKNKYTGNKSPNSSSSSNATDSKTGEEEITGKSSPTKGPHGKAGKKSSEASHAENQQNLARLESFLESLKKEKKPHQVLISACEKKISLLKSTLAAGEPDSKRAGEENKEGDKEGKAPERTACTIPPTEEEVEAAKRLSTELAERTPGVTPASISTIVNEAAIVAATQKASFVTPEHLANGIDNVLIGKKHRQRMSVPALKRVAFHEAGHTICQWLLKTQTPVVKVSIIPRGRAGGYTQFQQREELDPQNETFLNDQLVVMLGGRCAEQIFFADFTTGAMDDLQRAYVAAQNQVQLYGMSSLGHFSVDPSGESKGRAFSNLSETLRSKVEAESRAIVDAAYLKCMKLLESNREKLLEVAEALLEKRELSQLDLEKILGKKESVDSAVIKDTSINERAEKMLQKSAAQEAAAEEQKKLAKEKSATTTTTTTTTKTA